MVAQATRVLSAVGERWGHTFSLREALIGGAAIDETGTALPPETLAIAPRDRRGAAGRGRRTEVGRSARQGAARAGAAGDPQGPGLYANLRPVTLHPKLLHASPLRPERLAGVDLLVVRELTGGIYFGDKLRDGDRASDTCVYTVAEVERIVRTAARIARGRRKKLCSVDKANVLETSRLWREVTERVMQQEFPDVALSHMLVDACAMHLDPQARPTSTSSSPRTCSATS